MTPQEADYLLAEWARWQAGDAVYIGYPRSTPFGRFIVPDPSPSREPIQIDRALKTDRVIARLPGRYRFLVKLHYLDRAPVQVKARRLRVHEENYRKRLEGVQRTVAMRLENPL